MIDYYEILKVPVYSDAKHIRRAYYKLAKIWHPDKNSDSTANEKFQEICVAYKTLSDEVLRMCYDLQLSEPLNEFSCSDYEFIDKLFTSDPNTPLHKKRKR